MKKSTVDSRTHFVQEVATTIRQNHKQLHSEESFIFGLSGKWGEGKSYFLDNLRNELEKSKEPFTVIYINPWKFASDRVAFLRTFLKKISEIDDGDVSLFKKCRDYINNRKKLKKLYFDISEQVVHPGWVLVVTLFLGWFLFLLIFDLLPESILHLPGIWKGILGALALPIVLSLLQQVLTTQRSSRTVTTVDEFDELLKTELEKLSNKNIIIFLDDLDRVSPKVAREVLDNLRTFFDRPELSFVVTGDHSVLERYLGRELLPHAGYPAQLEEGRRFMKKIFNVYWRLPLPIETELQSFIQKTCSENETELNNYFSTEQQDKLKAYLAEYFERNFRQILRFLEIVLFTFRVIESKKSSVSDDETYYIKELLKNPLLVVRILLIQEYCTPLFESILHTPKKLGELEHAVENKDSGKIDKIIEEVDLSSAQKKFIKDFIYEDPRFYEHNSLKVSNLEPFLYFAADASFGDSRGPSSEDFIKMLDTGDPEKVENSLVISGEDRLHSAAKVFIKHYDEAATNETKLELLETLFGGLNRIPNSYDLHSIFTKELSDMDLEFLRTLQSDARIPIYQAMWQWLDTVELDENLDSYKDKFPFLNLDDLTKTANIIQNSEKLGWFTSLIISKWFASSYPREIHGSLDGFYNILDVLDKEAASEEVEVIKDQLVETLISDNNPERRKKRYQILRQLVPDAKGELRSQIIEKIKTHHDHDIWGWAEKIAEQDKEVWWEPRELTRAAIDKAEDQQDYQSIVTILNAVRRSSYKETEYLWKKLIEVIGIDHLADYLTHFIEENNYADLAPERNEAAQLFECVLEKAKNADQVQEQKRWLSYLHKSKWLWKKLPTFDRRKLGGLKASQEAEVKTATEELLDSWK